MENILNWYQILLSELKFYRVGVITIILLAQIGFLLPASLLIISINGGSLIGIVAGILLTFTLLVMVLGDAPPKVTVPVFIGAVVVQLVIIIVNIL